MNVPTDKQRTVDGDQTGPGPLTDISVREFFSLLTRFRGLGNEQLAISDSILRRLFGWLALVLIIPIVVHSTARGDTPMLVIGTGACLAAFLLHWLGDRLTPRLVFQIAAALALMAGMFADTPVPDDTDNGNFMAMAAVALLFVSGGFRLAVGGAVVFFTVSAVRLMLVGASLGTLFLFVAAFLFFTFLLIAAMFPLYLQEVRLRHQLERRADELRDANASLAESVERQRKMFRIIAHELRTPAATIRMLADEADGSDASGDIRASSRHLLSVIDDLRQLISLDSEPEPERQPFALDKTLHELETQMRALLPACGAELSVDSDGDTRQRLVGDEHRLITVLSNLTRNACLHASASQIRLFTRVVPDPVNQRCQLTFEVSDDGVGIPEHDIERLFQPFERGDTSGVGMGVGLYLVRHWAERMGGEVRYSANQPKGSRFTVTLTLPVEPPAREPSATPAPGPSPLVGRKVLVVEDDPLLRKVTQRQIQRSFGADVALADNGQEALDVMAKQPFDLMITDCIMPVMDGIVLIRRLREDGNPLPIIALTAATIGTEMADLREAGADAVLAKPLSPEALLAALGKINRDRTDADPT